MQSPVTSMSEIEEMRGTEVGCPLPPEILSLVVGSLGVRNLMSWCHCSREFRIVAVASVRTLRGSMEAMKADLLLLLFPRVTEITGYIFVDKTLPTVALLERLTGVSVMFRGKFREIDVLCLFKALLIYDTSTREDRAVTVGTRLFSDLLRWDPYTSHLHLRFPCSNTRDDEVAIAMLLLDEFLPRPLNVVVTIHFHLSQCEREITQQEQCLDEVLRKRGYEVISPPYISLSCSLQTIWSRNKRRDT